MQKSIPLASLFVLLGHMAAHAHVGHVADGGAGHDHWLSVMLIAAAGFVALIVFAGARARRARKAIDNQAAPR